MLTNTSLPYFIHKTNIPDNIFKYIKKNLNNSNAPYNHALAGNIKKEFELKDSSNLIEKYLLQEINQSSFLLNYLKSLCIFSKDASIFLKNLWINFQSKHEFNPVHKHDGIFSFILFIQIPYLSVHQRKVSPGAQSNLDRAGMIEFLFTDPLGKIDAITIDVDKVWEKTALIFPSDLHHCVYPFYEIDEYRITVSGNFLFKI